MLFSLPKNANLTSQLPDGRFQPTKSARGIQSASIQSDDCGAVEESVKALATRTAALLAVATSGALAAATPAGADDPPQHRVRYSVSATQATGALIYYRQVQPPNFGEYSHNPYLYSPRADTDVGPNHPWVLETTLADPADWAMVVVSLPGHHRELAAPGFVCELRVDDVVVATDAGTKGALCSLRPW
jgi:hypothetical protein